MNRLLTTTCHFLVLAGLLALAGCGRSDAQKPPDSGGPPAVKVVRPEKRTLTKYVEQPGTVRAFEEAPLFVKLPGYVRKVHVDIGDKVKGPRAGADGKEVPGTLLAELSIPELDAEAAAKQALAKQADAELEQVKQNIAIADAAVASAESLQAEMRAGLKRAEATYLRWQSESERIDELVKKKTIDTQQRDETLNQLRSADAGRDEARAKVDTAAAAVRKAKAERIKADFDVKAAEAKAASAHAEAERVEKLLAYTQVRAPFDGEVTRRRVDPGHLRQPPGGANAEPLFVVANLDTVRVFVDVPELDAPLVKDGAKAFVRIQALKGLEIEGTVTRSSATLDEKSRTKLTEIDLPNAERKLHPNMYVYARLATTYPDRLVVPASALVKQGEALVCYLIVDGKAVRTPVQTGVSDGTWTEVVKKRKPGAADEWEPFTGDETIAGDNQAALSDGAEVKTK